MIKINKENWSTYYKYKFTNEWLLIEIDSELFQTDDRGVELLDWISDTHDCVYSEGDGIHTNYVKLYKSII